ncbi:MAG: hypothetical protein ABIT76_08855 [Chthoniobacterales bacterium]
MKSRDRIDLGLAISRTRLQRNQTVSLASLAAYCDCHPSTILRIERRALAKVRKAMEAEWRAML